MTVIPAAAFVGDLHVGTLDDTLHVFGQLLTLQINTQRLPAEERADVPFITYYIDIMQMCLFLIINNRYICYVLSN